MWLSRLTIDWPTALTGFIAGLVIALLTFFLAAYFSPWSTLTAMREQQAEIKRLDQVISVLGTTEEQASGQAKAAASQAAKTEKELAAYKSAGFNTFLTALMSFESTVSLSGSLVYTSADQAVSFRYPAAMGEIKLMQEADPVEDNEGDSEQGYYFFSKNPTRLSFAGDDADDEIIAALMAGESQASWSAELDNGEKVLLWLHFAADNLPPVTAIRLPTASDDMPYAFLVGPSYFGKNFTSNDLHDFLQIAFWFDGTAGEVVVDSGSGAVTTETTEE